MSKTQQQIDNTKKLINEYRGNPDTKGLHDIFVKQLQELEEKHALESGGNHKGSNDCTSGGSTVGGIETNDATVVGG